MSSTTQDQANTNMPAVPTPRDQVAKEPRDWISLVVGVLASVLAAIPLGFALMYAWLVIAFTGSATVGGFGEAAQPASAYLVPFVGVAVIVTVVGTDILIGWAAARAVRSRRRTPVSA